MWIRFLICLPCWISVIAVQIYPNALIECTSDKNRETRHWPQLHNRHIRIIDTKIKNTEHALIVEMLMQLVCQYILQNTRNCLNIEKTRKNYIYIIYMCVSVHMSILHINNEIIVPKFRFDAAILRRHISTGHYYIV